MQPTNFPEQTHVLAKAQPQYRVLPIAIRFESPDDENDPEKATHAVKKMTCRYELSELELQQIIKTKAVYISQYGSFFHPIYPQIDSPFLVCPVHYKKNADDTYNLWVKTNDGSELFIENSLLFNVIDEITRLVSDITPEQILFIEKPNAGIDAGGNIISL